MASIRCAVPKTEAQIDFSRELAGARPFLQSLGIENAYGPPGPRLSPQLLRFHRIPLTRPLPLPETQRPTLGENPPDRGQTLPWPYTDTDPLPAFEEEE